jgi:lysophospholipase L1-like esterase
MSADDLIAAYRQMIEAAHVHGIRVIGCTITPFGGSSAYSERGEAIRQAVSEWIRTGGAFDGVIDFDAMTRDPANPKHIRADFDSGDHLHPQDTGYEAMADGIDLQMLGVKP